MVHQPDRRTVFRKEIVDIKRPCRNRLFRIGRKVEPVGKFRPCRLVHARFAVVSVEIGRIKDPGTRWIGMALLSGLCLCDEREGNFSFFDAVVVAEVVSIARFARVEDDEIGISLERENDRFADFEDRTRGTRREIGRFDLLLLVAAYQPEQGCSGKQRYCDKGKFIDKFHDLRIFEITSPCSEPDTD